MVYTSRKLSISDLKELKLTHRFNWFLAVGMLFMYIFERFAIEIEGLPVVCINVSSRLVEIEDLELF